MNEHKTCVGDDLPWVELTHLDELWFQVAGTVCNLTCRHCFISCSPSNHTFEFLPLETIRSLLLRASQLGVKEYYFTGGEPFLHPQLTDMLLATLEQGPVTVLTNATVLPDHSLSELAQAEQASPYGLEFRVSIDGFTAETNDPIRGQGTFDRAVRGLQKLLRYGFLPLVTAVRTWPEADDARMLAAFQTHFQQLGYPRPRIKLLPTIRLGAEIERTHGYDIQDTVSSEMLRGFDQQKLLCSHARIITSRGVHVCPLLIDSPRSLLGTSLDDALVSFPISEPTCATCYQHGAICSNR